MQQIPGHPDYACDEQGNIYSLKFNKIRKLRPVDNGKGYQRVCLAVNGKQKDHRVHRLIAKTFLQDYDEDLEVDHIDRCRSNNSLDNLRMVNRSENKQNQDSKGYYLHKPSQKWQAQIMINGKRISLGYHKTEEQAREAYLKGKKKYHIY